MPENDFTTTICLTGPNAGDEFRRRIGENRILPLIGIYDVFSALIASKSFEGVFCSGYSYAASAYGLPDVGYVNWRDMTDWATKVRHAIPNTQILVDVDDGFGDQVVAANTVRNLEANGLSAVMMEDQKRPRRCGHFEGKEILPIQEYLTKLTTVVESRRSIFVIARTDATDPSEGIDRAVAYAESGADGVMVEAIKDLDTIAKLRSQISVPIMVNQLHGGKSPDWRFDELEDAGASIVIYSTPCLFAAQYGIEKYLQEMVEKRGLPQQGTVSMDDCAKVLNREPTQIPDLVMR
ncbi:MAG: isocitrate lyase/PEP mutase family protein [Verrucomicrobia bacterium]|nr:isocitrate lyase/PEP mutase family protein [Verrucomicrobiota bacterium]MDA1068233.1 isocitrate lyase/PEP mutase family protein [Verrucomicrobiota bacterium]